MTSKLYENINNNRMLILHKRALDNKTPISRNSRENKDIKSYTNKTIKTEGDLLQTTTQIDSYFAHDEIFGINQELAFAFAKKDLITSSLKFISKRLVSNEPSSIMKNPSRYDISNNYSNKVKNKSKNNISMSEFEHVNNILPRNLTRNIQELPYLKYSKQLEQQPQNQLQHQSQQELPLNIMDRQQSKKNNVSKSNLEFISNAEIDNRTLYNRNILRKASNISQTMSEKLDITIGTPKGSMESTIYKTIKNKDMENKPKSLANIFQTYTPKSINKHFSSKNITGYFSPKTTTTTTIPYSKSEIDNTITTTTTMTTNQSSLTPLHNTLKSINASKYTQNKTPKYKNPNIQIDIPSNTIVSQECFMDNAKTVPHILLRNETIDFQSFNNESQITIPEKSQGSKFRRPKVFLFSGCNQLLPDENEEFRNFPDELDNSVKSNAQVSSVDTEIIKPIISPKNEHSNVERESFNDQSTPKHESEGSKKLLATKSVKLESPLNSNIVSNNTFRRRISRFNLSPNSPKNAPRLYTEDENDENFIKQTIDHKSKNYFNMIDFTKPVDPDSDDFIGYDFSERKKTDSKNLFLKKMEDLTVSYVKETRPKDNQLNFLNMENKISNSASFFINDEGDFDIQDKPNSLKKLGYLATRAGSMYYKNDTNLNDKPTDKPKISSKFVINILPPQSNSEEENTNLNDSNNNIFEVNDKPNMMKYEFNVRDHIEKSKELEKPLNEHCLSEIDSEEENANNVIEHDTIMISSVYQDYEKYFAKEEVAYKFFTNYERLIRDKYPFLLRYYLDKIKNYERNIIKVLKPYKKSKKSSRSSEFYKLKSVLENKLLSFEILNEETILKEIKTIFDSQKIVHNQMNHHNNGNDIKEKNYYIDDENEYGFSCKRDIRLCNEAIIEPIRLNAKNNNIILLNKIIISNLSDEIKNKLIENDYNYELYSDDSNSINNDEDTGINLGNIINERSINDSVSSSCPINGNNNNNNNVSINHRYNKNTNNRINNRHGNINEDINDEQKIVNNSHHNNDSRNIAINNVNSNTSNKNNSNSSRSKNNNSNFNDDDNNKSHVNINTSIKAINQGIKLKTRKKWRRNRNIKSLQILSYNLNHIKHNLLINAINNIMQNTHKRNRMDVIQATNKEYFGILTGGFENLIVLNQNLNKRNNLLRSKTNNHTIKENDFMYNRNLASNTIKHYEKKDMILEAQDEKKIDRISSTSENSNIKINLLQITNNNTKKLEDELHASNRYIKDGIIKVDKKPTEKYYNSSIGTFSANTNTNVNSNSNSNTNTNTNTNTNVNANANNDDKLRSRLKCSTLGFDRRRSSKESAEVIIVKSNTELSNELRKSMSNESDLKNSYICDIKKDPPCNHNPNQLNLNASYLLKKAYKIHTLGSIDDKSSTQSTLKVMKKIPSNNNNNNEDKVEEETLKDFMKCLQKMVDISMKKYITDKSDNNPVSKQSSSTLLQLKPFETDESMRGKEGSTRLLKKTIDDDETKSSFNKYSLSELKNLKMDKGGLLMRTHMITLNNKKKSSVLDNMFLVVKQNKPLELEELFMHYPSFYVDTKDKSGNTLLSIASQCGFIEIVKLLIAKGANVNVQNNHGDSPLHLALEYYQNHIADKLIQAGALQNIKNNDGKNPWDLCRHY